MGSYPIKLPFWSLFLKENVDQNSYQQLIQDKFLPDLQVMCQTYNSNRNNVIFIQDGAPAHFEVTTRNKLQELFPGGVISRGEQTFWLLILLTSMSWIIICGDSSNIRCVQDIMTVSMN